MIRLTLWILLAGAAAATGETPLARDFLAAHNDARAKVGAPPLVWSDRLAESAQQWADHLITVGGLEHRSKSKSGENLFEMRNAQSKPGDVVERWLSESVYYDHKSNKCKGGACGHYTQVVWRKTTELGCAVARRGAREVWVCEYNPPGNYIGQRPY